jgi:hypothetical protein
MCLLTQDAICPKGFDDVHFDDADPREFSPNALIYYIR